MKKRVKRFLATVSALILPFAASACGGDGSGSDKDGILFKHHIQTVYETGEDLGEFSLAVVENGKVTIVSGDDPAVTVEGFDSSAEGERTLTIRYKDYVKEITYIVLLPADQRPPEPGEVIVYTLEELQTAFGQYDRIDVEADIELGEGSTFVIPAGKSVVIRQGYTFTNNGTLFVNGRLQGELAGNLGIKEPVYDPDSGTFTVRNREELAWCSWAIYNDWDTIRWNGAYNGGSGANLTLDGFSHYVISIENDIDLSGYEWTPIGEWNYDSYEENTEDGWLPGLALTFKGEIRGNGHTIRGVTVSKPARNAGFIGVADYEASVYDLTFEDISIRGEESAGAVVGYYHSHSWADGYFENVRVRNAEISGGKFAGGLFGRITNAIKGFKIDVAECSFEGEVNAGTGDAFAGGIAGYTENYVRIAYCTASGTLRGGSPDGDVSFGGIAGAWSTGTIAGGGGAAELVLQGNDFSGLALDGLTGALAEVGNA